jgi:hypothetical protein
MPCNESPSRICGQIFFFLARQGERGGFTGVECAYRVLPEIVRSTERQEKLGELKFDEDFEGSSLHCRRGRV